MRHALHRPGLFRSAQGIAAVEFALTLPMMLALFFGSYELSEYLIVQEKAEKVATTIADMVAQEQNVTKAELADIMDAAAQEMQPFSFDINGMVIVSSVTQTGTESASNQPKVSWQYSGGGTLVGASKIGSVGGNASLPLGFVMSDKDNIIAAEVYYYYKPLISYGSLLEPNTLYELTIYKPRLGALTTPPS